MRVSRSFGRFARPRARLLSEASPAVARSVFSSSKRFVVPVVVGSVAAGAAFFLAAEPSSAPSSNVDWNALKEDIRKLIASAGSYDDGSYGPILIRLAWHSAGNFSRHDQTGGTNGATMRYAPESQHGGNAGLNIARDLLEGIKKKHPQVSYADLYSLAGTVAIETLGGPKCCWRPGRRDYAPGEVAATPDGRLPDAAQGADHLRHIFYRMGFSDQEIVALSGAHVLGRCHRDRSGFEGPWSNSPTFFSNDYFRLLQDEKWQVRQWNGPRQFEDVKTKKLMMLPSDMCLLDDPAFAHWVRAYAEDEDLFFKDFAAAWTKLQELGVERKKPVFQKLF